MGGQLCKICQHKPQSGYYCHVADLWINRLFVPGCGCFKRETDPVYKPPKEK